MKHIQKIIFVMAVMILLPPVLGEFQKKPVDTTYVERATVEPVVEHESNPDEEYVECANGVKYKERDKSESTQVASGEVFENGSKAYKIELSGGMMLHFSLPFEEVERNVFKSEYSSNEDFSLTQGHDPRCVMKGDGFEPHVSIHEKVNDWSDYVNEYETVFYPQDGNIPVMRKMGALRWQEVVTDHFGGSQVQMYFSGSVRFSIIGKEGCGLYLGAPCEQDKFIKTLLESIELVEKPKDVTEKEKQVFFRKKVPVDMLAFGDLLLDRYVRTLIERHGQEYVLGRLAGEDGDFFDGYDIIFANLEGAVTEKRVPTGKEFAFQFDPEYLNILLNNNINLVSIANNHTYDMGARGFQETVRHLDEYGISHVGDAKQVSELSSFEFEEGGYKFAFAAFNHSDFKLDIDKATELLTELRTRNDFVVASIHWGVEYRHTPLDFQKIWAAQIVEAGADIIIGHHPHVLQGMEFIDGVPVFYSLGNFVFDQWFSVETQESIALKLRFYDPAKFDEEGSKAEPALISLNFIPIQMEKAIPFEPTPEKSNEILQKFYDYSYRTNPSIENHNALFQ